MGAGLAKPVVIVGSNNTTIKYGQIELIQPTMQR